MDTSPRRSTSVRSRETFIRPRYEYEYEYEYGLVVTESNGRIRVLVGVLDGVQGTGTVQVRSSEPVSQIIVSYRTYQYGLPNQQCLKLYPLNLIFTECSTKVQIELEIKPLRSVFTIKVEFFSLKKHKRNVLLKIVYSFPSTPISARLYFS